MKAATRWTAVTILASAVMLGNTTPPAFANDEASLGERANDAFVSASWTEAHKLYLELSRERAGDAAVWFRLGLTTLNASGSPKAAISAYKKALDLGFRQPPALFGIARAHAVASNKKGVFETLDRLVELGPSLGAVRQLESNSAFDALRSTEQFVTALRQLTPCSSDEYRQFDFWLGKWEVQNPQGQVVGRNSITESLDGCLFIENWESANGGKGLSINYFDHRDRTWTQTYRDNTGNIANWPDLKGTFRDGAMILETSADAEPRSRWTWTRISEDKVRQMAESSSDGGKTWAVTWDSYYFRVKD